MKRSRVILAGLLCSLMLLAVLPTGIHAEGDPWGDVLQDNFVRITSAEAWRQGELDNLAVTEEIGDGALVLAEGQTEGTYISPELTVPAFEYMVASWGADTPNGTWVEIKARAFVEMKDAWSGWLSWGKWGIGLKRGSTDDSDSLAKVDTDTFTIRGSSGETSSLIQFMAVLHSDDPAVTPTLRNLAGTMKNTLPGQAIPVWNPYAEEELPEKVLLDSPCYAQGIRDSAISGSICSPTSITMMLNDRGEDLFPEEAALREYDFNYQGFGNWSYTVAIAGSYGYNAYVHYADYDFLRHELAHGRNLALSVRYSATPGGSNPYLENGAIANTNGHLITIVGYETIDGVDYFYSNDSAAGGDVKCAQRLYRADQLDDCWSNRVCYILGDEPEPGAGFAAPVRISAELKPAEGQPAGKFQLYAEGQPVELPANYSSKTNVLGGGTALMILDGAPLADMPAPTRATTANSEMQYVSVTGGFVSIGGTLLESVIGQSGTVYLIRNDGITYEAAVTFDQALLDQLRAEQAAAAQPEQNEPADSTSGDSSEASAPELSTILLIAAAVCAVIAAVVLLTRKKN